MPFKKFLGRDSSIVGLLVARKTPYSNGFSYDDLVDAESALGRTIFGLVPAGRQREFFKSRGNVWIWHENWMDGAGVLQNMTIRYEVRPEGVFKRGAGGYYAKIEGEELENFCKAAKKYLELVKTKLYC